MDFKNIENKYKPQPLWLWNSKLNIDTTVNNAKKMLDCSAGGFVISPSSGLSSSFLSEEWYRNISAALNCAADTCVEGWIYNRTSGQCVSSATDISSMSLEYHQKFLRCEAVEKTNERTIIFNQGYHFYYDENPVCIDIFNADSAQIYLNEAFIPYLQEKENISGFIFDISSFFSENIPWSFSLPEYYKNEYGEELLDVLIELFKPVGNYTKTRCNFRNLILKIFCTNFLSPIYEWCDENNFKLSIKIPDNKYLTPIHKAAVMSLCKYSHIPCFEFSSVDTVSPVNAILVSSTTQQLGKEQTCAMLYSACGHGRSFDDLKHIAQTAIVRGADKIIPCSAPYSLDGFRKNTSSTPVNFREFRQKENNLFNSILGRTCSILGSGKVCFDTLLIHNLAASVNNSEAGNHNEDENLLNLEKTIDTLEKKHIPFHLADETLLKEFAHVEEGFFVIGKQKYTTIVLTENPVLSEDTALLLSEFERMGGFIVMADSLKSNPVCDNENLLYTVREYSDYKIHYFVNNSKDSFTAAITVGSKLVNASTGEILPFFGIYKFNAYESILVLDDGTAQLDRPYTKPLKALDISGMWQIENHTPNYFLIDKCNVIINGKLQYENIFAQNLTDIISSFSEPAEIECIYEFDILSEIPELYLAYENYDTFIIKINGSSIASNIIKRTEYDLFDKINITEYLVKGKNTISLYSKYAVNEKFKAIYEKALRYGSEKDKITYPKEFTPIYLSGEFSVICDGIFRKLDKKAHRYIGNFRLAPMATEVPISNLEKNGFPFFEGSITLKKTINLSDTSYCIKFIPNGIKSICVCVNGKYAELMLHSPYECDLSSLLVKGDNNIQVTFTTTMRNLFGPHHLPLGELYTIDTKDYYGLPCIWNGNESAPWEENYCFIELGTDSTE